MNGKHFNASRTEYGWPFRYFYSEKREASQAEMIAQRKRYPGLIVSPQGGDIEGVYLLFSLVSCLALLVLIGAYSESLIRRREHKQQETAA